MQRIRLGQTLCDIASRLESFVMEDVNTVEDGHLELVPDLRNLPHFVWLSTKTDIILRTDTLVVPIPKASALERLSWLDYTDS